MIVSWAAWINTTTLKRNIYDISNLVLSTFFFYFCSLLSEKWTSFIHICLAFLPIFIIHTESNVISTEVTEFSNPMWKEFKCQGWRTLQTNFHFIFLSVLFLLLFCNVNYCRPKFVLQSTCIRPVSALWK